VRAAAAIAGLSLFSNLAHGESWLDHIREYDLNDYAVGIALSTEQNPYAGAKNGSIAYPYLTSFRDSAFTDDWFLIRDGGLGARWISESGWELGAIARVQTLGLGNHDSEDLLGIANRKWTIEAGPTIGWRGWPVHINWTTFFEPTDRHHGTISQLAVSLPIESTRGYVIPSVELIRESAEYAGYYYSVSGSEATASRPEYAPGSASNVALRLRWGYALGEHWLLSGRVGVEFLDASASDSPIVDRDRILSATLGLAYNADIFQPREYDGTVSGEGRFELKVGAFQDHIDSQVTRDTSSGDPGFAIDIEEILDAPGQKSVLQFDGTLRLGYHHRIEASFFELVRDASVVLSNELEFGDVVFAPGTEIQSKINSRSLSIGYGYSLIRDAQKELGVLAGLHFTKFETSVRSDSTGQVEQSRAETPLPVLGAFASVYLREKLTLNAKLHIFRTDFDHHEGVMNYATIDLQKRIGQSFSVGLGYSYYSLKLSSSDSDMNGFLKVRHHGPVAFMTVGV
jgi:outer membrane scaffolding protein for murein synthesis (MipA/OmpV family)